MVAYYFNFLIDIGKEVKEYCHLNFAVYFYNLDVSHHFSQTKSHTQPKKSDLKTCFVLAINQNLFLVHLFCSCKSVEPCQICVAVFSALNEANLSWIFLFIIILLGSVCFSVLKLEKCIFIQISACQTNAKRQSQSSSRHIHLLKCTARTNGNVC